MYDKESFEREQPLLANLFKKAREHNHLSHAFLLYGENSAPLLDSSLFLAKSLFCKNDLLACSACSACLRFDEGNQPDFLLVDGADKRIKKEDIKRIEDFTSLSSAEKGHVSCYVINHVENISEEAINALLKTIEEPSGNTIAFLTTSNKERVLPTIISRCEPLQIRKEDLIRKTEAYQGEDRILYYLVSKEIYDENAKEEKMKDSNVLLAYSVLKEYTEALKVSAEQGTYVLMKAAMKSLKGNSCYNELYRMLSVVLSTAFLEPENVILLPLTEGVKKYQGNLASAIAFLGEIQSKMAANLNGTLVLSRFCSIMEEKQ